jgi:hypothetical protein
MQTLICPKVFACESGLPVGLFSNQKSKFGEIFEGLAMKDVVVFYGHLVHFTVFCYILWTFGIVCGNLVYFFRVGILYQEKSGNPAVNYGRERFMKCLIQDPEEPGNESGLLRRPLEFERGGQGEDLPGTDFDTRLRFGRKLFGLIFVLI